jgi:type I restriction enzyme S subunit
VGELHLSSAVFARPLSEHRKYIELFFRSPLGQNLLKARIVGSVSERINTRDVESLSILLPTSKEEAAITNILGTLDDKIALNRRMNGTLEVTVGTIFKQWFVDFEFPNEEGKPYKSAGGEMTYNEELREEIPNGWEPGHLGDVADNPRRGIQPETVEEGTPYIGLEHMPRRSIALSEWGTTEEVTSHKFKFQQGEILFGKLRPYFHKVGVATVSGVCSTDILIVVPKSVEWYSLVLSHVSSDRFVSFVDAASTGTRMPRTNWENMARYQLLIPTYNVVQKFNDGIVPLLGKIRANILQSRTLITTRDLLLPKLLSGKIVPS